MPIERLSKDSISSGLWPIRRCGDNTRKGEQCEQ
jgi:hypothetical protein